MKGMNDGDGLKNERRKIERQKCDEGGMEDGSVECRLLFSEDIYITLVTRSPPP